MNVLGIIAARRGSKRLPLKNILTFCGRPLIAWTIQAALESDVVDRLVVSTDCPDISKLSVAAGAEVPFVRPADLATDSASGTDVILHALEAIERDGPRPKWILCLQATSPLRTADDIRAMFVRSEELGWREAASFRSARPHALNVWHVARDGRAVAREGGSKESAPEMEESGWFGELNGAMYLIERDLLVERRGFFTEHLRAFRMPEERSVDIDTQADFAAAEAIMNQLRKSAR